MDNRTKGIVATVAAVVLCGCPGLFFCVFGALTAAGNMPFSTELNGVTNTGTLPSTAGFVFLCVSLLLILVPVAVWFFTLRGKPAAKVPDGPMPPAS